MATGTILSQNLGKVLDLLEYAFDTRMPSTSVKKQRIVVLFLDLERAKIKVSDFAVALHFLKEEFSYIRVVKVYDFINEEGPNEPRELAAEFHTIAELIVPSDFKARLPSMREILPVQSAVEEPTSDFYTFNLTKDGKLYRKVNDKVESYSMTEGEPRHRLIKALNKGARASFHSTKSLIEVLDVKTANDVYRAVTGIRRQIKMSFTALEGEDFIDSKRGSGYRLGSHIRIAPK